MKKGKEEGKWRKDEITLDKTQGNNVNERTRESEPRCQDLCADPQSKSTSAPDS